MQGIFHECSSVVVPQGQTAIPKWRGFLSGWSRMTKEGGERKVCTACYKRNFVLIGDNLSVHLILSLSG